MQGMHWASKSSVLFLRIECEAKLLARCLIELGSFERMLGVRPVAEEARPWECHRVGFMIVLTPNGAA